MERLGHKPGNPDGRTLLFGETVMDTSTSSLKTPATILCYDSD